ncbi:MAG: ABC transporter ATP-binding protein [Alphaproteobacteria bacterium 65-7]|nr:MAG: ABC transporter ATP-binding protein [Alphaproteobacteria bacterium 65-7]
MGYAISLRGLVKRYGERDRMVHVLNGFSMEVAAGEFLALMGPSGAGKTTLLNLMGGLDRADAGSVVVDGTPLETLSGEALARWRAQGVGLVFQSGYLLPMLTAAGNVALPLLLTRMSRAQRRARVMAVLEEVGLGARAGHKPGALSGGQQQRVGVARAIVHRPGLLLCDEPTAALDRDTADSVLDVLAGLNAQTGTTIVMVTHDPVAAARACRIVPVGGEGR